MDFFIITGWYKLLENAQVNWGHVLEPNVSCLRLHRGLRIHLVYQFQHGLHVENLNHILDDLEVYKVFN